MDVFESIRITCLRDVYASKKSEKAYDRRRHKLAPDTDFLLKQVFRWYSKVFFTPLHQVEKLPISDVLEAWWCERYEEMNEEELEAERLDLFVDPEETERLQRIEDAQDAEVHEMVQEELAAKAAETVKKIEQMTTKLAKPFKPDLGREPEMVMGPAAPRLPDIKITFDDSIDMDSDGLGLLDKPKKR